MKKTPLLIFTLMLTVLLSSCSAAKSGGSFESVSMYDLSKEMVQAGGNLAEMSYASSQDSNAESAFSRISDMDYGKVDSFFVSYATDGSASADEIVVIAVRNIEDAPEAEKSLKDHLDYRMSLYRTYGAKQLPKLEKAEVFTDGNYAVLIVADSPGSIRSAFNGFISR